MLDRIAMPRECRADVAVETADDRQVGQPTLDPLAAVVRHAVAVAVLGVVRDRPAVSVVVRERQGHRGARGTPEGNALVAVERRLGDHPVGRRP